MASPIPDKQSIKKFLEYRMQGKSFRDIQKLMGKDLKTLWRWSKYSVGDLSTGKVLTVGKKGVK